MASRGHNNRTGQTRKTYGVRVNHLPRYITKAQLHGYFDGYGGIESVAVIKHGGAECHGFVNFHTQSHAQEAAENMNSTLIGGKVVECKASTEPRYTRWKPPADTSSPRESARPSPIAKQESVKPHPMKRHTVKVTCIAKATTERTLFDLFSLDDGEDPESIRIVPCPNARFNHAFVNFYSHRDAKRAAEMLDCSLVDGSEIRARFNSTKESAQQPGKSSLEGISVLPCQSAVALPTESGRPRIRRCSSVSKSVASSGPSEISCSSLVASILHAEHKTELEREHEVKITFKLSPSACIKVSGRREKVVAAEKRLRGLKEEVEKGIFHKDFNLPFHCVPLFEQDLTMKQLRKIETSHRVEFSVLKGTPLSNGVSMASFSNDVKQCFGRARSKDGDSVPNCSEMVSYFSKGASDSAASCRGVQWFFKDDDGIFVEYTPEQSTKLEQMYQVKIAQPMSIKGNTYVFDFTAMTQSNVHSRRSRAIQRDVGGADIKRMLLLRVTGLPRSLDLALRELRDAVKSTAIEKECRFYDDSSDSFKKRLASKMNRYFVTAQLEDRCLKLRGVLGYVERVHLIAEQEKISEREAQIHAAMGGAELKLPVNWRPQREEVILDAVKSKSVEWMKEVAGIQKTLRGATIVRLERIQNKWLWERYSFAKKRMVKTNKGHVNEEHLFHGTRSTPPEKVFKSEKGVDFRFSREGLWGTGSYFAVNASYSDAYAYSTPGGVNEKQMFICKVLTGDSYDAGTSTDRSLRQPPLKPGQGEGEKTYDSVKGHTNGSDVYVVYDHEKVYPAYLVTYFLDGQPYTPSSYQPQVPSPRPAKKDSCLIS